MHQNGDGAVTISDVAYTVGTTQNASARQTPLVWAIDHVVCGGQMHGTRPLLLRRSLPNDESGRNSRCGGGT